VELESFSRAAEELFLSQPAVSLQIRHLERELGVALIDRTSPRPAVTPAGTALLAFAEQVEAADVELHQALAALHSTQAFVSIGCSATSAKQFVPGIISEVGKAAPDVHVRVITLPPDEAAAKMLRGELDFILTTEGFVSGRVEAEQILTARLFVVCQPTNPLARRARVSPEEIARFPFALLPAPWSAQARFHAWAKNQGVEIRVAMELSSYDGLKEAARKGLALAVVAESALIGDVARGDLAVIHTVGLPLEYPIFLAHRTGPLTPHAAIVKRVAMRMRGAPRAMLPVGG
jgi:DNA-binding transcriptional LysR family regulator